jgi:hypothetical protein
VRALTSRHDERAAAAQQIGYVEVKPKQNSLLQII